MSGILRLESLTKGNTLKQGDKTPLKYRLFDADGDTLNVAGKPAKVRLVYPDFLTIGYEKDGLTVAQDDTVTFTIESVIPSRIYHVEIIVDDKFVFPSRSDEAKFTVDKSSLGTETNIIEIVGVDAVVRKAVDLINDDPSLIIDEDKLVTDIISNTGIGNINEYYKAFNDLKPKAEQSITKSAEALTKSQNALNVANGIDAKATNALSLSESADTLSKSVQEQFNQVVIDGDSSVEAAQARVDASGQTNPTLKARLDKEHNEVTAQLAQKVGGAIKAEPENLSATTLGMITGNGGPVNLLSIPQDESVDAKKLSPKLTKPSYNILDESTIETTGYYRYSDGVHIPSIGFGSTSLIPVKPNEEFTIVGMAGHVTYWKADGTSFIRGIDTMKQNYQLKVPDLEGIAYVRINLYQSRLGADLMMILKGHYDLEYLPYYRYGEMMPNFVQSDLMLDEVKAHHIAEKQITDDKFAPHLTKPSYNILDESTVELGNYYQWQTGIKYSGQGTTPLIPVKPNEELTAIETGSQVTFWEADGTTYVSGIETSIFNYHLKVPDMNRIKFMRILIRPSALGSRKVMILRGHYELDGLTYYKYGEPMLSVPDSKNDSESKVLVENMEPKLTKPSYNILDESTIETTGYYRFSDGVFVSSVDFGTTPLIPVKPNDEFTVVRLGGHVTYWKADGTSFIRGINANEANYQLKVPDLEGIAYVRISLGQSRLGANSMMMLKGYYDLEYLPYYRYGEIMPNYIREFNKLTDDFRADLVKDTMEAYEKDLNFIKPFNRVKNPIITRDIVTDRINPTGVADPFIVMDKGRYHMFFEVLGGENPTTGKKADEIGHAYSDNLIDWTYTEIVLSMEDKGHRSAYPNVFKMDGEWYMLPDASSDIVLYKATNFPTEWELQTRLLMGTFIDTNVFKMGDTWYLTTLNLDDQGLSLYINTSSDWKNSNWTLHPKGVIIPNTPEFGQHRGAGNHMIVDDCVYLPIQEVPEGKGYGYSTRLYKLANLSPTTADAVDMGMLTIAQHNGDWNSTSMHHVSYAKYLDRKIFAVDGTGSLGLGYSIGLYVENYV